MRRLWRPMQLRSQGCYCGSLGVKDLQQVTGTPKSMGVKKYSKYGIK